MNLYTRIQDIMHAAELGVLAARKMDRPQSDEVTKTGLYRLFSRRWVDFHIKRGNLVGKRRGIARNSPIMYSRLAAGALRIAEGEAAKLKDNN